MPGPGGGSRGGGGGFSGGGRGGSFGGGGFGGGNRGGGFGGGPRPGGFGGPHHRPPHHHHHGPIFGWGWGPRRYYHGGGGCLGPAASIVFVVIFFTFLIIYMLLPGGETTVNFGKEYDEAAFQQAADQKYAEYFASGATYEDNILLYVLVEEECDQIYYIAWVGDNIHYDIAELFGGNSSVLGNSIYNNVPEYYAYSLDSNLAAVMNDMEKAIGVLSLPSSFKKATASASPSESRLVDLTGAGQPDLTAQTVNDALASFTESTGIRTVIAVDYIENVFPTGGTDGATVILIIGVALLIGAVAYTSYANNKNKKKK